MHLLTNDQIKETTAKYSTALKVAVFFFFALAITFVVFKIIRASKKPVNATYVAGAPIPIGWGPEAITDQLFHVIDGTFLGADTVDDAYKAFNSLNDNQMIAVYNQWLKKKYDEEKKYYLWPYGTLTNAVKNGPGVYSFAKVSNKDQMIANLDRLHLE